LGNDTLKGGNGDDKLSGERGNDLMEGGKGDDMLIAGEGDEGMLGNEGNDVLNGGEGVDIMAGGLGNDTFICDLSDILIDFNSLEEDKIIGSCSVQSGDEEEGRLISDNDIYSEEFQSPPLPLNPNDSFLTEEFQSGPPPFNPNFESQPPFHINDIPPSEFPPPPLLPPQQPPLHLNDAPSLFEPRLPSEFQLPPLPFNDRDTIR
jgi:hypothetical protein